MSIRTKTWLILAIIIAVLASSLIVSARFLILKGYEDLESEFARRAMDRARNVLMSQVEKLNATAGDYSTWDATYQFINHPEDTAYKKENFLASSFINVGINGMLFFNSKGELVSQPFFKNGDEKPSTAPPALVAAIRSMKGLSSQPESSRGRFGILAFDSSLVMVAARPILKNDQTGPSRGTLVFCCVIDSPAITRLSSIIGQSISLTAAETVRKKSGMEDLSDFARSGSSFKTCAVSRHELHIHSQIRDISGANSIILTCSSDRDIYRYGLKTYYYGLGWLLFIVVVFSGFVLFTIEHGVLSRLTWLRKAIDAVEEVKIGHPSIKRIAVRGRDEVAAVATDINDMLSAIEQTTLRAELSEKQYGQLFSQMLSGFALHEVLRDAAGKVVDYRFLDVNPAFEQLTGLNKNDIVGKTARELLPDLEPQWIDRYARVVDTGEPDHFEDFNVSLKKHFEVMAFRSGENRFGTTFSDITGRRKAEEERATAQEELAQARKMEAVGQLAGGIAHDFNNQMTSVLGYAELLRQKLADNEEYSRFSENIIKGIRRATNLTSQLLAFARKGKYRNETVNMHSIITEVVSLLEHSINKNIEIVRRLDAQPSTVLGDPNQLQNMVLNLGLNARDAMPGGGRMTFATGVETLDEAFCKNLAKGLSAGSFLRMSISDTGIGIDEETLGHIFEPFFTTKPRGKGTGMGLASAYGTARHHNGTILVNSEPGKGATFTIYLPLTRIQISRTEPGRMAGTIPGNPRILLVEDEDLVAEMTTDLLSSMGCRVNRCRNGGEAIDYYRNSWKETDLIILDMIMPGMGGRETLPFLKEINPAAKIIISSGYTMNEDAQAMLQNGAIDFLQKPYERDTLVTAVVKALRH
jgi:PAS domain S-box-containing protein